MAGIEPAANSMMPIELLADNADWNECVRSYGEELSRAMGERLDEVMTQMDGEPGRVCRTCRKFPAVYLGQCEGCREKSTREDDRRFLE